VIPERRMYAKGAGAYGAFTVTGDIILYEGGLRFGDGKGNIDLPTLRPGV
jgi:catalase